MTTTEATYETADIAVITPTAGEWQEMLKQISDVKSSNLGPLPTKRGTISGHSVVCCSTGKGQEETASALTLLLERAKPRWLFLVGIAGGFPQEKIHRGDVVVAHVIHNFDYGKLTAGVFKRRPENDINCDRGLLSWAEVIAGDERLDWRAYVKVNRPESAEANQPKAHVDCYVASSNKVVDDPDHIFYSSVKSAFPEIHAVEMEGTGAGASARLAQGERAVGFLMIRGISDEPGTVSAGGSDQRIAWRSYAAATAAAFTRRLIEELPSRRGSDEAESITDSRILNGDINLLNTISLRLAQSAPRYRVVFDKAVAAANVAYSYADQAQEIARAARRLLAPKLSKISRRKVSKRITVIDPPYPAGLGEIGITIWDSGDEYTGQFESKVEAGLGVHSIFSLTREANPNTINTFMGESFGGKFGRYGVYTFSSGGSIAGEWLDGVPRLGIKSVMHSESWFDVYFGGLGITQTEDRKSLWVPHGFGVGLNLEERVLRCFQFSEGETIGSEDISLDIAG